MLKVHGDYLDPRILNTAAELAEYPAQIDDLLHRIFNEYGLIICGWSGDWDLALRAALERASSRRYTTYWTTQSRPSESAECLITHRRAEVISIEDADRFFEKVAEDVTAIDELSKPHPLSVEVAVTKLKRYMAEPRFRIQLSDLIDETVQEVVEATSGDAFTPTGPKLTPESVTSRVRAYDAACSKLTSMAVVAGTWAETEHGPAWHRALERLSAGRPSTGMVEFNVWQDLQRYPATLLLYALGLGAVESSRLKFLNGLLMTRVRQKNKADMFALNVLPASELFEYGPKTMQVLAGMAGRPAPLSDWIHNLLRVSAERTIRDDTRFTRVFDELEVLIALAVGGVQTWTGNYAAPWCPCYWRGNAYRQVVADIRDSVASEQADSSYVRSHIFGDDWEDCYGRIRALDDFVGKIGGGNLQISLGAGVRCPATPQLSERIPRPPTSAAPEEARGAPPIPPQTVLRRADLLWSTHTKKVRGQGGSVLRGALPNGRARCLRSATARARPWEPSGDPRGLHRFALRQPGGARLRLGAEPALALRGTDTRALVVLGCVVDALA